MCTQAFRFSAKRRSLALCRGDTGKGLHAQKYAKMFFVFCWQSEAQPRQTRFLCDICWSRWNRFVHNEVQLSITHRYYLGDLSRQSILFLSSHGNNAICFAVVGILIVRILQSQWESVCVWVADTLNGFLNRRWSVEDCVQPCFYQPDRAQQEQRENQAFKARNE